MILDSCFCIDLFRETSRGKHGSARRKLETLENARLFISLFSLCELRAGAQMSNNPSGELKKLGLFMEYLEVLYPGTSFPVLYGELEAMLRKSGTPIPVMDLLIAVTAKSFGMPLLTRDLNHFSKVPGLVVETY